MKLEEFKKRLENGCQKLNFPKPKTARQGFSFMKVELKLSAETSIEIYFNQETQSLTSALINRDERIFSRSRIGAVMHMAADTLVGHSMTEPKRYFHNRQLQ